MLFGICVPVLFRCLLNIPYQCSGCHVIFVQTGLNKSFRPKKRVRVNEIPEYGEAHGAVCSVERKIEIDRQLIWWESEIKGIDLY